MTNMKDLQDRVNEIVDGLLDGPNKLRRAKRLARVDGKIKGLLLEILDEALEARINRDIDEGIEQFINRARIDLEVEKIKTIGSDFFK